ncbi:PAS domain-containing protein [Aquicoccus sp. SCR17]|nr:PAS domain-containing protein [Carideicomes alvinocaridis]
MAERDPLVVGIGASAGGLSALEAFFGHVPSGSGMAFVVIQHLNPDRTSHLPDILGRATELAVESVTEGAGIEPNKVYVIPAGSVMWLENGTFRLRSQSRTHREYKPIDVFFSSLAEDQGENAVGIVMSGFANDGTLGVKAIKECGGITMAQLANEDSYRPDMPESAIATGLIDFTGPAGELAEILLRVCKANHRLSGLVVDDTAQKAEDRNRKLQQDISRVLRRHSGHDFSGYKRQTFLRRIARRMKINEITTTDEYLERLRSDPTEGMTLFRDLLISVTNFFRDAEPFDVLARRVIPQLFEANGPSGTVRVWVPGCATGEEVYSLAILMAEQAETLENPPQIQIFATDIDERAIAVARAGRYPSSLLGHVSEERLSKYFTAEGASYVIANRLREMCVFSSHNIISHPPFSRMDLVSCRNLLIYLGNELQDQVLPTFHYALKPGGYLFLGTSESVSRQRELFATIDRAQSIFQAREGAPRHLPLDFRFTDDPGIRSDTREPRKDSHLSRTQLRHRVEGHMLEHHTPAHVVVTHDAEILYFSAGTSRFMEIPRGAPNRQLLDIARRELRIDLREALREAIETNQRAEREVTLYRHGGEEELQVLLTVDPLDETGAGELLYLVVFGRPESSGLKTKVRKDVEEDALAAMERELRDMRERMQSTVEEYETALEELKASNEELVSVNEEAQSTNEELEASKEEMQSLNEELKTINAELNSSLKELDQVNTDLKNLYKATEVASVFLDREAVVRNFTPAATDFFNLREADLGRPLTDLTSVFDYPDLQTDIATVQKTGDPRESKVDAPEGGHHLVRLNPYSDEANRTAGVVITIIDITALVEGEKQLETLISELNHRVKNMLSVVISIVQNTRRNEGEIDGFTDALLGRLHGLSRTYSLLSEADWTRVSLADVIGAEAEVHGYDRFDLDGQDGHIGPTATLALGLVLHELATNATKYGALSTETGKIAVRYREQDGQLVLTWQETGGPRIETPPEENGFGLSLIEGQIEHQLGGTLSMEFPPEGLLVTLSFPL